MLTEDSTVSLGGVGDAVSLGGDDLPRQSLAGGVDASFSRPTEDSSRCAIRLSDGGDHHHLSQPATHDIPTEDSSGRPVSLGGDDRSRQLLAGVVDVDAILNMLTEDITECAVSMGGGGDCRHQSHVATRDVPTEDSSGCAVSLGGDDRPRQSLAGGADASFSLPTEDSSGCAVTPGDGGDRRHQSINRDIPTEDSSGCAVSLGGDDRSRQSLAGGADASFNLPTEDSSGDELMHVRIRRKRPRRKELSSDDSSTCSKIFDDVDHRRKRLQKHAKAKRPRSSELTNDDDGTSNKAATNSDVNSHGVRVAVTHNSVRRKWDRKHFCKFCMTAQSKLSRHMFLKHMDEAEVAAVACIPLKSRRRKVLLRKLLNDGDYQHNVDVLEKKAGEIIPFKRPSSSSSFDQFIPCEYCHAMFVRRNLWKHKKTCDFKPSSQADVDHDSKHCQGAGSLLLPYSCEAGEDFKREVMSTMHQDEVTAAMRTDDLIMKFGTRLFFKHGHLVHRKQYIRDRLRQVGRLLLYMRNTVESISSLTDCIVPDMFAHVVKSVRSICGFDEEAHIYTVPSLALKMGYCLKECTKIEINCCTVKGPSAAEKKARYEEFLLLCDREWSHEISSHALRSLHQRKFNKPVVLPLAEDVKLLHDYLAKKAEKCTQSLSNEPSSAVWNELSKVTLTQVIIFNRRRGGEAERLLLSTYCSAANGSTNEDVDVCLSQVERTLCKQFRTVNIEGKRGRKVPVLLTSAFQAQVTLLVDTRKAVGVSERNKFVFARSSSRLPHRSSDCLRTFAHECGARNPAALTSTKLRKHIATMSQMLSLKRHELDLLANFLGHDIRIHREFYRLPEETLQMAKVSKLLLAMERGETTTLQGRNFDDISVNVAGEIIQDSNLMLSMLLIYVVILQTFCLVCFNFSLLQL